MKKFLMVSVLLCVFLAGCRPEEQQPVESGKSEEVVESAAETVKNETEPAVPENPYNDSLIEDCILEGTFTDGQIYSFHIPLLREHTEDAEDFNSKSQKMIDSVKNGEDISCGEITWDSYWNESLLSLVVKMSDRYIDYPEYLVFNYDFELGRAVSREELLERSGTGYEEYLLALRKAASAAAERDMIYMSENNSEELLRGLMDLRMQTISNLNLSDSRTHLFMKEKGELCTIVSVATPAGGGWYPAFLTPDFSKGELEKTVKCEFISAHIKDNQVEVTFENTEMSKLFLSDTDWVYDYPYTVYGLYGNYTDIAVGFMGNGGDAYLFLIDDQGLVTYCNLFTCMKCCAGGLIASGPLPCPQHAETFSLQNDGDGYSVSAVLQDGTEEDLYESVFRAENTVNWPLNGSVWEMYETHAGITVAEDTGTMYWYTEDEDVGSGQLIYLGMTGEGQRYAYTVWTKQGEASGYLTLGHNTEASEGGYTLSFTQCDGYQLPGMYHEDYVEFFPVWN